jgi:hypothetical protein
MLTYKCIINNKEEKNITSFSEPEIGQVILSPSGEQYEILKIELKNNLYYIATK